MIIEKQTNKVFIASFDSVSEFAEYAQNIKVREGAYDASISQKPRDSWCLNTDLDAALAMGTQGGYWPEGAENLQNVDISDSFAASEYQVETNIINDVTGGMVDIGAYLVDDPECFFRVDEDDPARPIVKIFTMASAACSVSSKSIMNHKRALLALVDALEAGGYSVELVAGYGFAAGTKYARYDVTVKQAGEPWSAASVAFAMAHPASFRRLAFRALEGAPNDAFQITNDSYGYATIKHAPKADFTFEWLTQNRPYSTPEQALETVLESASNQNPNLLSKK